MLFEPEENIPFMLNTIKMPKNLHYLTDRLPSKKFVIKNQIIIIIFLEPNYSPSKFRKSDKYAKYTKS